MFLRGYPKNEEAALFILPRKLGNVSIRETSHSEQKMYWTDAAVFDYRSVNSVYAFRIGRVMVISDLLRDESCDPARLTHDVTVELLNNSARRNALTEPTN
jgi:hypothetical protein